LNENDDRISDNKDMRNETADILACVQCTFVPFLRPASGKGDMCRCIPRGAACTSAANLMARLLRRFLSPYEEQFSPRIWMAHPFLVEEIFERNRWLLGLQGKTFRRPDPQDERNSCTTWLWRGRKNKRQS